MPEWWSWWSFIYGVMVLWAVGVIVYATARTIRWAVMEMVDFHSDLPSRSRRKR